MQLSISRLTKVYPNGTRALDEFSLSIGTGLFGLLGPNGAGKSTLMRTIATLQQPDSGEINFGDIDVLRDPMRLRKVLGYLPQEFGVYPGVSAERLLEYFARLKGMASRRERHCLIDKVLEITNLLDVRKKAVSTYSGGMKQRFGIAQLLLNNPRLIIVDEPTAGLDPAERKRFLNILRELGHHSTVILSTHIVDDVKGLCQELAIMNEGRLLKHARPAKATQAIEGQVWTKHILREELESAEANYQLLSSGYNPDNTIYIRVFAREKPGLGFTPAPPELEDVYFKTLNSTRAGAEALR